MLAKALVFAVIFCLATEGFAAVVCGEKTDGAPRTGRFRDVLVDKEGQTVMEFWARVPQALPAKPHLGIVFSFYGVGGGRGDNWDQGNAPHHMRDLGWESQYIFVSPRSQGDGWSQGADGDRLKRLIAWFLDNYPVDPRRVYLYGFSSGGFFVGPYAVANDEVIAGAFCVAGNVSGMKRTANGADRGQEFFLVCGTDDSHRGASQRSYERLRSAGYQCVYREIDGATHNNIQGHDPSMKDGFIWLHALRHKTKALSEEDAAFVKRLLDGGSAPELWLNPETARELARIGGPQASAPVVKALESGDARTVKAAAEVCAVVRFDSSVVRSLALLHMRGQPAEAMDAVAEALAMYASYRFGDAQTVLCRTAVNRRADSALRLAAIRGIGKAARMQAMGSFDDRQLFEALVICLTDGSAQIRRAAFDALLPVAEDGHGFNPDAEPRTRENVVALQKWERWFAEQFRRR